MKKFEMPMIEVEKFNVTNVITASAPTVNPLCPNETGDRG